MKNYILLFLMIILGLATFENLLAQKKQEIDKYLIIKPLVSNKNDVEKLYGKGTNDVNNYLVDYKTKDAIIIVEYTYKTCGSKYSIWDVPEWTVEEVTYASFRKPPSLAKLIGNKKKFKTKVEGDVAGMVEYYDEQRGIFIEFDNSINEVVGIRIKPSKSNAEKYKCKSNN